MKNVLLALPLLFVTPSCETVKSLLAVPAAAVHDVGDGVDAITPGEQAAADTAGTVASTGVTIATGNPAVGAAAGALVTGLAVWFFGRRKKTAPVI